MAVQVCSRSSDNGWENFTAVTINERNRFRSAFVRCGMGTLCAATLLAWPGCATYREKPLDQKSVDAALMPPTLEAVRLAANQLKNPLLAPVIIDDRDGLSPDEIALIAVIASPQLRALRAQRGVLDAQVLAAGILPNPQLGYALDRPTSGNEPGLITGRNLGLSWEITSLLGRHDRLIGAKKSGEAFDLSIAWQEWQAAQDARLHAFGLLSLRTRLPLLQKVETDFAETLAETRRAAAHGRKTAVDVASVSEAWLTARSVRLAAEQEALTERNAINLALGRPGDADIILAPAAPFPEFAPDASADQLLQGVEKRRLDLVALSLGYDSQEASLRAAIKAQFPKIGLSFAKANDTSNVRTHTYGVTIDLPLFDRNQGNIAIARATREQLFDEYVARVAEARGEVVLLLGKLASARAQREADEAELPELERVIAAYEIALKSHNADITAFRDARSQLVARQLDESNVSQQMVELGVALEIATGRPLLNRTPLR
jgi:outer membrane protein TolC